MKRKHQRQSRTELHALLDRAREERWSELALISTLWPKSAWPEAYQKSERVFQIDLSLEALPVEICSLTDLTSLFLLGNEIGAESAKAIAGSLTGLTSLNLSENEIGDEGAKAIAASLTGLTSLDLYNNQIGDEGAKAIAGSLTGVGRKNSIGTMIR